jgi:hypothetical protein
LLGGEIEILLEKDGAKALVVADKHGSLHAVAVFIPERIGNTKECHFKIGVNIASPSINHPSSSPGQLCHSEMQCELVKSEGTSERVQNGTLQILDKVLSMLEDDDDLFGFISSPSRSRTAMRLQ